MGLSGVQRMDDAVHDVRKMIPDCGRGKSKHDVALAAQNGVPRHVVCGCEVVVGSVDLDDQAT